MGTVQGNALGYWSQSLNKYHTRGINWEVSNLNLAHKKRQATYIAPLRPYTLAAFPPWGILQELVV